MDFGSRGFLLHLLLNYGLHLQYAGADSPSDWRGIHARSGTVYHTDIHPHIGAYIAGNVDRTLAIINT